MSNAICKHCKREWLHLGMHDKCPYCRAEAAEAEAEQIKRLREALAQIQRNASANRVWSGEKWTYLGLTYVAQTKIVRLADEALKEASK